MARTIVYRVNNDYLTEMQPGDVRVIRSGRGEFGGHVIGRIRRLMSGLYSALVLDERTRSFRSAPWRYKTETQALVFIADTYEGPIDA